MRLQRGLYEIFVVNSYIYMILCTHMIQSAYKSLIMYLPAHDCKYKHYFILRACPTLMLEFLSVFIDNPIYSKISHH